MRALIALILMTTPAFAHPGAAVHLHESEGFFIAALAFGVGMTLSAVSIVKAVRAKA